MTACQKSDKSIIFFNKIIIKMKFVEFILVKCFDALIYV